MSRIRRVRKPKPLPYVERSRCACGRIAYATRFEARQVMLHRWTQGGYERSSWWCEEGDVWHLSPLEDERP